MSDDTEYWTTNETAAYLRRPPGTLRQWRHRRKGPPSFKQMGLVQYNRAEVIRWQKEQEAAEEERRAS
ncbi:excisionase [Spongiactinospora gelatinilytica]|uniref:Excisionase n=1 Tax=Spongiactinospora gelatinilytica TaxID=2666298 RepID=A0A2W2G9Q8_9ACTN|nr:helix-turn-helix domain-containing protein [Spongiactinospora gelatinilytica]PZG33708.1 excisionase [Spongiactinospora gelatinilytica]